jgi:hypothetical protein
MRQRLALALVLVPLQAAAADFQHVRSEQTRVRALLRNGYERSATFRALIDELESLQAIVYIDETPAFSGSLAGALLHTVTGPRNWPILRVLVKPNLASDYEIAILAHELQHACEALRDGAATSPQAMTALFRALDESGGHSAAHLETRKAREIAAQVIRELQDRSLRELR